MSKEESTYIGDGVYASFDGYQIWLASNNHENKVIALEPSVLDNLIKYANKVYNIKTKDNVDISLFRNNCGVSIRNVTDTEIEAIISDRKSVV